MSRAPARRKRVRVGIRHHVERRSRYAGRNGHLVDDVLKLSEFQLLGVVRRGLNFLDRPRSGGCEDCPVAAVVARDGGYRTDAEGRQRSEGHRPASGAHEDSVEPETEDEQKGHKDPEDEPSLVAIRRLLLVEVHGRAGLTTWTISARDRPRALRGPFGR